MPKHKGGNKPSTANSQEKLINAVEAFPGDKLNQGHNSKKEALGPNTNRNK